MNSTGIGMISYQDTFQEFSHGLFRVKLIIIEKIGKDQQLVCFNLLRPGKSLLHAGCEHLRDFIDHAKIVIVPLPGGFWSNPVHAKQSEKWQNQYNQDSKKTSLIGAFAGICIGVGIIYWDMFLVINISGYIGFPFLLGEIPFHLEHSMSAIIGCIRRPYINIVEFRLVFLVG